ncbi:MAG: hypothetical protein JXL97_15175 [Bacteroidales bacterium]|nr:hypothetical protein [Bacteroidales bacterium]
MIKQKNIIIIGIIALLFSILLTEAIHLDGHEHHNNSEAQKNAMNKDTITLDVKITNSMGIGWGHVFSVTAITDFPKEVPINKNFTVYISVGHELEKIATTFDTSAIYQIKLHNTNIMSEQVYMPAGYTGVLDKDFNIWELLEFIKL